MKTYYSPEGEAPAGGAVAESTVVVDSPESFASLARGVFKEPPVEPTTRPKKTDFTKTIPKGPQKTEPKEKEAPKVEPGAETKPDAAPAPKRTSIFDAPKEEKKPDAAAPTEEVDDGIPENDWKAAKAARKELARKLKENEDRLARYHQEVPDIDEVKRLKEEHKTFSDRLSILDWQNHPDFHRQFIEPKKKVINDITTIFQEAGIEGVDVAGLLTKPRVELAKTIAALDEKLDPFSAGEVKMALREGMKLNQAEREALAKHAELRKAIKEQEQTRMRTAFEDAQKTESFSTMTKPFDLSADAPEDKKARWKAFNDALPTIRQSAEKYAFSAADERTMASVATKAANYDFFTKHAFPQMMADYQEAMGTIKQLSEKLSSLSAHKPKLSGDGSPPLASENEEEFDLEKAARKLYRGT
jgi:hypothetical protein